MLLVCIAAGAWYLNSPPFNDDDHVYFVIRPGEPLTTVAQRLRQQRLIRSALLMRFLAQTNEQDTLVQSGSYSIPTDLSVRQLITFLTTGRQLLVKVTIPEGLTITKIATVFAEHGVVPKEEFVRLAQDPDVAARFGIPADTVEGYLFPNTYFFNEGSSTEEVMEQMIAGFRANLNNNFPQLTEVDDGELHRIIILASMIEKEYISADEAPLISSVFQNRLKRNQRLEACSTVVYLITEIEKRPHPSRLYFTDLQRESPYNTYRNFGLPPTPIANPGNIAIDAALNPADTDYLYFVLETEDAAAHRFSETFAEHSQARIIYLRSRD